MARPRIVAIREALYKLISPAQLKSKAREIGAVRRERKVDIVALFWTVVLGFAVGRERTMAALRRAYAGTTGTALVPSAFYDRFTKDFARFMKAVAGEAITALAGVRGKLRGALESFKDLLVTDSTVIRLHWMLEKVFPACRTNHTRAAAKLHVVMSVKGAGMKSLKISSERCHDGPVLTVGKWVKERLLLFDLGYFRWQLFDCITRNGGYFISRLKGNANPVITGVNHSSSRYWQALVGRKLWDFLPGMRCDAIDMEIEVSFRRRQYRGTRRGGTARFRLVGVRNPSWGGHHLYVTNVPADKLSAEDVARTYSARWWVELLFKEMKQAYRLEQMPSGKKHIVESLLYATILTLIASRQLMQAVRHKLRSEAHRLRHQRFAAVFASMAPHILLLVVQRPIHTQLILRLVSSTMLAEAVDPNASRPGLIESVETRTHRYDARRCLNHGL